MVRRKRDSMAEGLKHANVSMENQENTVRDLTESVARCNERVRELHQKLNEVNHALKDMRDRELQSQTAVRQHRERAKERDGELARIQDQLHELRFVKEDNRESSRMADALHSLRSMHSGIRGRLVDLCDIPNPKYRNAVTVAFGRNLEAVVVDTTETALSCVRYLKEQRLATMTFLPLNSIQGRSVDDNLRTLGGTCKPVIDVVKYEPSMEPAVRYALGQTLVCDAIEEARRIAYHHPNGERHKVVTVDGSVLLKNGSVQGGLAAVQSRARKWDEKKYDDLKAARERLLQEGHAASEAELARSECELRDLRSRIEFASKRIASIEAEIHTNESKSKNLQLEIKKQQASLESLKERAALYKADIDRCDTDFAKLQDAISAVESKIFGDFQQKVKIPNISQWENREAKESKVRAEKRQQLQLVIGKLKASIESESKRVGVKSSEAMEQQIKVTEREIGICKKDLETYDGLTSKLQKKQQALQECISKAKAELDVLEENIRRAGKSSEAEVRKLAQARKHATMLHASCDALRLQRLSLFQACRMEEVDIPTVDPSVVGKKRPREETTARGRRGDSEILEFSEPFTSYSDTDASRRGTAKEVQVCIDFSNLTETLRMHAKEQHAFQTFKQKTETVILGLEREIESIAPNLKASTKFSTSETKLESTALSLDEARERARKALVEFTKVKELRCQRFMTAFERIAERVDGIYRQLTLGTRAQDVHGSAYLTLEDPEEPYNGGTKYHATPPLKRFMTMDLLSGGERTIAALALLFAIHAMAPTPFFILDEVDAALDIGNVQKLASYLRANCNSCQFIVVSLKEQLYHVADTLIGVFKDQQHESSGTLTLDMRTYSK
jgi:structural maintenance of chromosome 1